MALGGASFSHSPNRGNLPDVLPENTSLHGDRFGGTAPSKITKPEWPTPCVHLRNDAHERAEILCKRPSRQAPSQDHGDVLCVVGFLCVLRRKVMRWPRVVIVRGLRKAGCSIAR